MDRHADPQARPPIDHPASEAWAKDACIPPAFAGAPVARRPADRLYFT
jgi:hypothetical protein